MTPLQLPTDLWKAIISLLSSGTVAMAASDTCVKRESEWPCTGLVPSGPPSFVCLSALVQDGHVKTDLWGMSE